ncbi:F-box/LRR-repeat protein, partial [Trifolium medium]|nr:F-box/LRR-repeat protein [Trifolium medium]
MEQEEDKLSNLPKIILHNILSRLPEDDANRTSVLSKAWLETWYTFPILYFSDSDFITESIQPKEDIPDFIRLCCIPETISWNLDNCDSSKAFVE